MNCADLRRLAHLNMAETYREMGAPLYRKMGFREIGRYRVWAAPPG